MYYLSIKKKEMLPFATTWMDLESIMLSEISQTEKGKFHLYLPNYNSTGPREASYHMERAGPGRKMKTSTL